MDWPRPSTKPYEAVAWWRAEVADRAREGRARSASSDRMANIALAAFYRRYNVHRFEDLAEIISRDVAIDGTDRGLDAYAAEMRAVVRAFPDYRWELRRLVVDAPCIAAHFTDTGTHRRAFLGDRSLGRRPRVRCLPRRCRADRRCVGLGLPRASPRTAPEADVETAARRSRCDRRERPASKPKPLVRSVP